MNPRACPLKIIHFKGDELDVTSLHINELTFLNYYK